MCNSSAGLSSGSVSVEVSLNGRDFTSDGGQVVLSDVLVGDVSPWSGPEQGGTVVTVSGSGLDSTLTSLSCRFGASASVQASVHSSSEVRCVSPLDVLPTGWSVVELVSHGSSLRSGGSFYVHSRMWVSSVHPLLGPVVGGTRLGLVGSHFRESSTLVCRFEEASRTVSARYIDSGLVECSSAASSGVGAGVSSAAGSCAGSWAGSWAGLRR
mgnify:CR=1 FL=1